MRVTESHVFGVLANNLQRSRARLLDLQRQVSTGKAVSRPSDDPSAFHHILHHKVSLAAIDQRLRNISFGRTRLDFSDQVLTGVSDSLSRLQQLAVQFRSDTNGPAERVIGAAEVRQLFAQLQQLANTGLNGQPIFTGTSTHGRATGLSLTGSVALTDGVNDTLIVEVDGVRSGTIDLTSGTESLTGEEAASRLQSLINADTTLAGAGKRVTVTFDTDRLVIASDSHGLGSQVSVVGGSSRVSLGFDGGSTTTGEVPFALTATVSPGSGNTGGAMASQGQVVDPNAATLDDYVIRFTSASTYEVLNVTVPATVSASAANTGSARVMDAGMIDPRSLTLHQYRIQFTSPTQYSVLDVTASTTVSSGNVFVSGAPIEFDGLRVVLAAGDGGGPQTGDQFDISLTPKTVAANQPYLSGQPLTVAGIRLRVTNDSGTPAAGDLFAIVTGMQYQGDDELQPIEVGPGQTVPTNLPGSRAFTASGADIFGSVKQLVRALRSNDRTGITETLGGLNQGISHVGSVLGEIGALSNRMAVGADQLEEAKSFYSELLSRSEDVDLAKAISDLMLQQYVIEAAGRTLTQVFDSSLLRYLR
ncbi:MAG: flagellin [Nitrospira sp.]|nr:flagellin [Nitrospira sp.]